MDPGVEFWQLTEHPIHFDRSSAVVSGAVLPLILPSAWLPPELRARWLIDDTRAPLADRLDAALQTNQESAAWSLLSRNPGTFASDPTIAAVLMRWQKQEIARLQLKDANVIIVGEVPLEKTGALRSNCTSALNDVRDLLEHAGWPRWTGSLVVVCGDEAFDRMTKERHFFARPVLPFVRFKSIGDTERNQQADFAGTFADLTLALCGEPAKGWPAWFAIGVHGVARAKALGQGPSPRGMQTARQKAGKAGLTACLTSKEPSPEMSTAICAYLLHSKRRHLLPNLMELLRHDVSGQEAIGIAYQITIDQLLTDR